MCNLDLRKTSYKYIYKSTNMMDKDKTELPNKKVLFRVILSFFIELPTIDANALGSAPKRRILKDYFLEF